MADEVLPIDEKRAEDYSKVNPKDQPLKYLHQDGSVTESQSVDVINSVLPAGAATADNQETEITLLQGLLEKETSISIDADAINLNTDGLETLLEDIKSNQTSGTQKAEVTNMIPAVETGLATSANQETLNALIETLQELCRGIASIAGAKGIAADLRTTILSGTVSTVSTVNRLADITQVGTQSATTVVGNLNNIAAQANINNIGV